MSKKLYKVDLSPPARAAMVGCDLFGVPVELIEVKMLEGEHKQPEYLKKNPLHTVPVFEDCNLIIHDSHAILMYLADVYGKDDSWYPKDVIERAKVNQILFFEASFLITRLLNIMMPAWTEGQREVPQKNLDALNEAYAFVEEFLSRSKFIAGDKMTIADISACIVVQSLGFIVPIDTKKYPKIGAWIKEMEKLPAFEKRNEPGAKAYKEIISQMLDL